MISRKLRIATLLAVVTVFVATALTFAQSTTPAFTTFLLTQGTPFRVCVESPQTIWYTLPAQNALGRLTLPSLGLPSDTRHLLPTANSEPYDVACAGGLVWLTERLGNKIAAFNPATNGWTEYTIPTANSQPVGLEVQTGATTEVWFAERAGNKIGRLSVNAQGAGVFNEYASPVAGMQLEDVDLASPGIVWFTAPGSRQIGRFNLNLWQTPGAFGFEYTGATSQPWNIAMGDAGNPWFTDRAGNRVGQFAPGTQTNIIWYPLPGTNSQPSAIETYAGKVWFSEIGRQRVARLEPPATTVREQLVTGSAFTGISFDANACAWLADSAQNRLVRWCSPYFRAIYLPLIRR